MSVTLNFPTPVNYNLSFYEVGQSTTETGTLAVVSSGTSIGTFPEWINEVTYSGANTFWYAVRFGTDDGGYTSWTDRMYGRFGAGVGYFIVQPATGNWIYLVPPQIAGVIPAWFDYNYEYTVTIKSSDLFGSGTNYMSEDYEFTFTAEYCPVWSTPESVRLSVGPIIDGIPDDTINRLIFKATNQAITKFFSGTNPFGCTYTTVPEQVYRWVTCMAGLFALNAAISTSSGLGNTSKKLGQLAITYDTTSGAKPSDIRKTLSDCVDETGLILTAIYRGSIQSAIKSYTNTHITHPMADATWGRQPRKVPDNIRGPWQDAPSSDVQTYSVPLEDPEKGVVDLNVISGYILV